VIQFTRKALRKRWQGSELTTRIYFHQDCLEHLVTPGHPERPDRLRAIENALKSEHFQMLEWVDAPQADPELLTLAHPRDHIDRIRAMIPEHGLAPIDMDTTASPKSWLAVLRATGAATDGVDAVFAGNANNVFAAVRPPGHHAEKRQAMGFCLVNTAAVAARYAQQRHGAERVAIVDFDVHHGNGTQDIFWDDPSVFYASTHQMPLYPGTGALAETGAGNVCNAPLREGDDGYHFREAFKSRIIPALVDFQPDLIIISAGFDAHALDPLAGINLNAGDFDWVTGKLMEIAGRCCRDRIVSLLEGGYDLRGLAESTAAHVNRLMHG
jgi:acetoin utilization deacetylase AcuC-like enzyme